VREEVFFFPYVLGDIALIGGQRCVVPYLILLLFASISTPNTYLSFFRFLLIVFELSVESILPLKKRDWAHGTVVDQLSNKNSLVLGCKILQSDLFLRGSCRSRDRGFWA
jgi:hypothetical protein